LKDVFMNSGMAALAVLPPRTIVLGGQFTNVDETPRPRIARLI
jgi:hypothetical protein